MVQRVPSEPTTLYELDETAWLEQSAALIRAGRLNELDLDALADYLTDMAKRDRREVTSRLSVLLAHRLKWHYQPELRSRSCRGTLEIQRQELSDLLESGVLRTHAENVLAKSYMNGIRQAAAETELPTAAFPTDCPFSLDEVLSAPVDENDNS